MARTSDAELMLRVGEVTKKILAGEPRSDILRFVSEEWGVTERTGENYLKSAREKIAETAAQTREYEVGLARERFDHLWHAANEKEDYWLALAVLRESNSLMSLKRPDVLSRLESRGINTKTMLDFWERFSIITNRMPYDQVELLESMVEVLSNLEKDVWEQANTSKKFNERFMK